MKRGLHAFILLIILFFLAGCTTKGPDQPTIEGPFVGGTDGLEFGFAEEEPPQRVLDNNQQSFLISLITKNLGEYPIEPKGIIASISGIDKKSFNLKSLSVTNTYTLEAVSKDQGFVVPGAEEFLEFGEASYVNDIPADFSATLRADVCYHYQTEAISNLCLKKEPNKRKDIEDVCDVVAPTLAVANSGGPLQVESMRQTPVGSNKLRITFAVTNTGGGLVYPPNTFTESCSGHEREQDQVHITLKNPQNNFQVTCSQFGGKNAGLLRLVNNKKELSCTIDTTNMQDATYQDIVHIILDYTYREAATTNLIVENSL